MLCRVRPAPPARVGRPEHHRGQPAGGRRGVLCQARLHRAGRHHAKYPARRVLISPAAALAAALHALFGDAVCVTDGIAVKRPAVAVKRPAVAVAVTHAVPVTRAVAIADIVLAHADPDGIVIDPVGSDFRNQPVTLMRYL